MDKDITFIMHSNWISNLTGLSLEDQDKILGDIVRYGAEFPLMHENEEFIGALVNMVKKDIDYSKTKYAEKITSGEKANGRKKKLDDQLIWNLAHNEDKKSEEIAQILGYSKSSVDHSEGWRRRKEKNFGTQLEKKGFSF